MSVGDPDRLSEALRANLRRRKERMRAEQAASEDGSGADSAHIKSFGADEEGDVPPPVEGHDGDAWVSVRPDID